MRFLSYDTLDKNVEINKIVVTYPNVAEDGQEYMNKIRSAINEAVYNLLTDDKFQDKDKFAQDVKIVVASEAEVAARALEDKVKGSFATIDVGGGTIDIAYTGNKASPHSDDSWAIQKNLDKILKDKGINSSPFALASFKRKGFARDCRDDSSALVKCNECTRSGKCVQINGDEELDICSTITDICTYQKDSNINSSFAYIIRKVIPRAIHEQALQSVVLLGGGSHMIFIQEALQQAFSDLGYNNIQYWTITPTNGERYNVVYKKQEDKNEKNITPANFLAYAAALFGELQRTAEKSREAENNQKPESGTGTEFTGEAADLRIVWEVPSLSYAIQYNDNGQAKYVMFPKNSFASDGNIYMIAPGIFSAKEPNDTGTQVDLSKNIVFIKQDRSNIEIKEIQMRAGIMEVAEKIKCDGGERSISADDVNKANTIGPKEIAHKDFTEGEFACVICIKYCGGVFVSYDKKLQIYLYRSPWHDQEQRFVLPNDGEKPYFAEGELTEERKRQLGADYDFNLTFKQFMELSGQNLKC